jgi:radical SAM superfamily enzyme YgiQ (UPF0313 family)
LFLFLLSKGMFMKMPARPLPIHTQSSSTHPVHPLGAGARVLLTSVFGPYAQDDEYGSRAMNPMELYHNQVTREQGPFSLRMFHRSWGLMFIQANLDAPCTLLDFPTLDRFVEELRTHRYDVVGISSIIPNVLKVKKMVELVHQYQPGATVVVGGHVANVPDVKERTGADIVVKGEGVRWFRQYLGEDPDRPLRHPQIISGIGSRNLGIRLREEPGDVAATVIPSVGCPMGCNFCSTSAMFGGKGKAIHFFETGDELFDIMCQLEESLQVQSFFVMDENFLLHRKRALRLLELMQEHGKAWALYVFSSANALRTYTIEQLVGLGITWVWLGLEGENSQYTKLHGTDAHALVRHLQTHGIRVLGSTIIGLENHTPENMDEAIDYAVSYDSDFHQFMLYTPIPGTPLHAELAAKGLMKDESEYHVADIHGQYIFNYRHPRITGDLEAELIQRAFRRSFEVNGPSVVRIMRTTLAGWRRYKDHPEERIRRRFAWEARDMGRSFAAALWGAKLYYHNNPAIREKIAELLAEVYREFGWTSRLCAVAGGPYVWWKIRREEKRLARGWTYEPPTFYECNEAARAEQPEQASGPLVPSLYRRPLDCRVAPPAPQRGRIHDSLKPVAVG